VQSYRRGVAYLLLAGLFLSTSGVLFRYIDSANIWTVLFYRSLGFSATVFTFMWIRRLLAPNAERASLQTSSIFGEFKFRHWTDVVVTLSLATSFTAYILSLFHTTVANTVLIVSTGPVMAALLGWLILRERISKLTALAIAGAIAGVFIMVSGGLGDGDVKGILFSLLAVSAFAVMIVSLRFSQDRDSVPFTCLAGLLAALVSAFVMPGFAISASDLLIAVSLGAIQIGFGFTLITLGSRSVPSAEIPLLCLGETALAPIWVWLAIGETPGHNTLIGGAFVLSAVLLQGILGVINSRR